MPATSDLYEALTDHMRRAALLEQVRAVLTWDQQTHMPPGGAQARTAQVALAMQMAHDLVADPRVTDWLGALEGRADLDEIQRAAVRNIGRAHHRSRAVPPELITRLGTLQGEGFNAWLAAREANDFSLLEPVLSELVEVTRARIAAIDGERDPYEVQLDDFDVGSTVAGLTDTFARLRDGLTVLLDAVSGAPALPRLTGTYAADAQRELAQRMLAGLGYDTQRGRLDPAEHPFTATLGMGDVRITTRVEPDNLLMMLGATVHEIGHALYEQGLPADRLGSHTDGAASMGMHESQSRFWENTIGRSMPFCEWLHPMLVDAFGDDAPSPRALFEANHRVEPGLVRVTADEVTYNLHIIIRFELEKALIQGDLAVPDLAAAWNDRYRAYLGVEVPDDRSGVLQDIHWPSGAFGYFPSYSLGNLYAASFGRVIASELPDLEDRVRAGDFAPILDWLRSRIHARGSVLDAPDLMAEVVGDRDHVEDLLAYLWGRHGAAHGLTRPR